MKSIRTLALVTALAAIAPAAAEEKRYLPELPVIPICLPNQAMTYTLQCDPGSRSAIGRIWSPQAAGAELCKVYAQRCEQIPLPAPDARPGFEVQDSRGGHLVFVGFGLDRLLGEAP